MNRYSAQLLQSCSIWLTQWIDQFGHDDQQHLLEAIDDVARFRERSTPARAPDPRKTPPPSSEIAWLAVTPDPVFRHVMGEYLESLLVDPDWDLERVDRRMSALGRARTAARSELQPILDGYDAVDASTHIR